MFERSQILILTIFLFINNFYVSGGVDKSPTFGKPKHLTNGHAKERSSKTRHRQISFSDSESDAESEPFRVSHQSPKLAKKTSVCDTESDSTHITHLGTQDSLETVSYSYEENSERVGHSKGGGLKRKLSEVSNGSDTCDEQEKKRERKDAIEQLKICFPHKSDKV